MPIQDFKVQNFESYTHTFKLIEQLRANRTAGSRKMTSISLNNPSRPNLSPFHYHLISGHQNIVTLGMGSSPFFDACRKRYAPSSYLSSPSFLSFIPLPSSLLSPSTPFFYQEQQIEEQKCHLTKRLPAYSLTATLIPTITTGHNIPITHHLSIGVP